VVVWWVKTKNDPSDLRLKQGRGNGWVTTGNNPSDSCLKQGRRCGVVTWQVSRNKTDPSDSHLKRGRGVGGDVAGQLKHPLRLAFEVREGVGVVNKPTN
jgi:hypothetical protein